MGRRLSLGEIFSASIPLGTIGGSWLIFLASCLVGRLSSLSIWLGTSVMVLLALFHSRKCFEEIVRLFSVVSSRGLLTRLPVTFPD